MTQEQALNILKSGRSVFLTGAAGSGKTYILNKYIDYLKKNGIGTAVTASTGIASTHMSGQTVHSWSGIGVRESLADNDISKILKRRGTGERIRRTHTLIIDEISMLHDFQLDLVDRICRAGKENNEPFGGMQVVISGDFFQLPPVAKGGNSRFAFESDAWQSLNPGVCYLKEQHRHGENILLEILNGIRRGGAETEIMVALKERMNISVGQFKVEPTRLFTHNVDVDLMNRKRLGEIRESIKIYRAETGGAKRLAEALLKNCLAPEELVLKKGAVVMFVKNNFEAGYVNGTLGKVIDYGDGGFPVVKTFSGEEITAYPESWMIEEEGKTRASVTQVPLRLAWAITVHKSQGMSLDGAEMDLSKTFEKGMGYVALSRARTFEGIVLLGINDMALRVREDVMEMDEVFIEKSKKIAKELVKITGLETEKAHEEFLGSLPENVRAGFTKKPKESTYEKTKKMLLEGATIEKIAEERNIKRGTVIAHIEKLAEEGGVDISHVRPPKVELLMVKKAFESTGGDERLAPAFKKMNGRLSFDDIRLARIFLRKDF